MLSCQVLKEAQFISEKTIIEMQTRTPPNQFLQGELSEKGH